MKRYSITVNGKAYDVAVEEITDGAAPVVAAAPAPVVAAPAAQVATAAPAAPANVEGTKVTAPMPGTILDVKVSVGDTVESGSPLFVLEAMKMENDVNAPCSGKVVSISTTKGTAVETGTVLAVIQ